MVITDVNQITYNGDGVTTAWPFTFPIIDYTDLRLTLINEAGARTDITSDYYVDMVNNTVYYPGYAPGAEPPEANQPPKVQSVEKLEIYRRIPVNQLADLGEKWPFNVIEKGLDKLTMIIQDIYGWIGRNIIALTEDGTSWDARNLPISNVGGPVNVEDAATKDYVDRILNGFVLAGDSRIVPFDNVAQMIDADIAVSQIAATLGYYDINDGGDGVYNIRAKTPYDVDDGNIIIFLDNGNVAEKITNTQYDLNIFPGATDTERLANALNMITSGTIRIGDISIDETINISKDCREIIIFGGKITLNTSVAFTGTNTKDQVTAGCPVFEGCVIVGDGSKKLYDDQKNVGATFIGCVLSGVVIYDLADTYAQSLHLNGCKLYGYGNNATAKAFYDLRIVDCQAESSSSYIVKATGWVNGPLSVTSGLISGNVIEGRSVVPIQVASTSNFVVSKNYFEANSAGDIKFELADGLTFAHCFIEQNYMDGNYTHIVFNKIYSRSIVNIRDNYVLGGSLVSSWVNDPWLVCNNALTDATICPADVRSMVSTHESGAYYLRWDSAKNAWLFDIEMINNNSYPEVFKIYFFGQQSSINTYSRAYLEATAVTTYGNSNHVTVTVDRQIGDDGSTSSAFGISVDSVTDSGLNAPNIITFKITGFVTWYADVKVIRPFKQETMIVGKNLIYNI